MAFSPRLAIVSPHADDETLGCGALMARLAATHEIHVILATDGSCSPRRARGVDANPAHLAAIREREAAAAMQVLGLPRGRLHCLRFPDGQLRHHEARFRRALVTKLGELGEADMLVPFRYDWHPDHIAVHRAAAAALRAGEIVGRLVEYFVYTQRRLLWHGDVRAYLDPSRIIHVAGDGVADVKLRALQCFTSQTTLYFPWQRRPILRAELLQQVCARPEAFVEYDATPGRVLRSAAWIRVASVIEPPLKRAKDNVVAWLRD